MVPSQNENANTGANAPGTQQKKVQVQLGEKEAEGIYANMVLISHSASEFIFDFARMLPGSPKAKVYSRIVMNPQNSKLLYNVLKRNIAAFEKKHGTIEIPGGSDTSREIGFK
jgi:Protein of unknown function (DUF3467)